MSIAELVRSRPHGEADFHAGCARSGPQELVDGLDFEGGVRTEEEGYRLPEEKKNEVDLTLCIVEAKRCRGWNGLAEVGVEGLDEIAVLQGRHDEHVVYPDRVTGLACGHSTEYIRNGQEASELLPVRVR